MVFLQKLSFRAKIGLGTMLIVLLSSVVSGIPTSRMAARALMEESKKRGKVLANNIALRAVEPMLSRDLLRLKNMVDEGKAVATDIDYAFIADMEGAILAHTFHQGFPLELKEVNGADFFKGATRIQPLDTGDQIIYDIATPVMVEDAPVGTVRIGLSRTKVQQEIYRLLMAMIGLSGGTLLVAIAAGMFFSSKVTRRINLLRAYAESLVTGNLEPEIGLVSHTKCWESNRCELVNCPAYGDEKRRCWYLAGTLGLDDGSQKGDDTSRSCLSCPVYRHNRGDEIQELGETLDAMALSLKNHIGELRKADKEIRRQERLMRTILDVTPDLVSLQGRDLLYRAANKPFASFVDHALEEIVGSSDKDLLPNSGKELLADVIPQVIDSGQSHQQEIQLHREGRTSWFHVVLVPVEDLDGRVTSVLRTARDITRVKEVQRQLLQAQKMESLGKLAGGVAHEINTPLGVILGYAQLLQEDVEKESQVFRDLQTIERQAKVCRQIVADLLGFSRQATSAKREMCFNNSLLEAISLVRHTFEMSHVDIVTDVDDRMPIIYGDPEKLKQVWINLLNNARDAMESGGTILVSSRLNREAQQITATVSDTGSGIPAEDLKQIFDPFFSTKAVGDGTGLGLSVSFGIIKDHQGSIRAVSPVPKGTFDGKIGSNAVSGPGAAFIVSLPLDHSTDDSEDETLG
jgi:PAS domain S-box-containing protein